MMVSDKTVLESIEDLCAVFLGCSHDTIFFCLGEVSVRVVLDCECSFDFCSFVSF